jgi:pimeloyl-ACP methyl ester carboxylesterase
VAALVTCALLCLPLSGCGIFASASNNSLPSPTLTPSRVATGPTGSRTPPDPALAPFYRQKLHWHSCAPNRCTTLRVPLDYADPTGKTIGLSVLDVPSRDPAQRIGALVVNPGGPGVSGVAYAQNASLAFGSEILQAFDVVGFDPRGVGTSDPIHCVSSPQLDRLIASDPDPDTAAERNKADAMLSAFGRGCVRRSGALAAHVSTLESAKDMDILRAALGEPKLIYYGASYGTYLGATYAGLFPTRVGRMVLDGALNPALSSLKMGLVQAHAFEVALRAYVANCVSQGGCYLGPSVNAGTARIRQFLAAVEKHPIRGSGGRQLKIGNAVYGIWYPLYSRSLWSVLDQALGSALHGDGAQLLAVSDAYTSRGAHGYTNNSMEALIAITCLDRDDAIPSSKAVSYDPRFERASPTFGDIFAYSLSSCENWPIHTHRTPAPIHARGAPPILVIGTTRDPATPLSWARALAHQLQSGVLIRRDGDGHTGYHAGNACVDTAVESYLVSDKVPSGQVNC